MFDASDRPDATLIWHVRTQLRHPPNEGLYVISETMCTKTKRFFGQPVGALPLLGRATFQFRHVRCVCKMKKQEIRVKSIDIAVYEPAV
jgi:hypothetical protein